MGKTVHLSGFRSLESAEEVKAFLERCTGKGTVYAIEVKLAKKGGAYAKVQFTTTNSAQRIITLANERLYYGSRYLKAFENDLDIIPKPKAHNFVGDMENVTLHFGCQVSHEKYLSFWKKENVTVNFGFHFKKIYFFLSHQSIDYKLQLSFENIWQIERRHPHGQAGEFILIQLSGAPRIFEKPEASIYNYFKETPDDQWVRTTDFTPYFALGQSSALCLGIPRGVKVPDFSEIVIYKDNESRFILEHGCTYSQNSNLVPVVAPPQAIQLPYNIYFKICILVQNGYVPGPAIDDSFYRLVDPRSGIDIAFIEYALEKLFNLKECCYDPVKWYSEQYLKYCRSRQQLKSPTIDLNSGLVYIHRVQITPCRIYYCGPEVNVSNRVLRKYPQDLDNFLRVSFLDEEWDKMYSTDLCPRISTVNEQRRTAIYNRILSTLRNGIVIGDKKFEFLAFSSSQLRDNSAWMFASTATLDANDIRRWMGDFRKIRNVAKYAARLGQSFSSSTETLSVRKEEFEVIPDVEVVRGQTKYIFSDGIGKISADFARDVAKKCKLKISTPSAFQIRYGGYKGVVAVDPTSSRKLSLRRSMHKFESDNIGLDVLAWSKYQPCFLNRQLISLLSTLGVKDHVFEKKQKEAVDQLDMMLTDPLSAQEALVLMYPGENANILKEMLSCGYKPDSEPYLSMMLQTFRASKMLDLRTKTRIFISGGRSMMGCLDETRTLEYGQVFVQFSGYNNTGLDHRTYILQGKVFVAKNPCLHPGDVRVLRAVNVPALHHMVDCVVFPQKGTRPHPNECSGSDLDGDIYFVCWDPDLIPPRQQEPMDYTPEPSMELDHEVTIEEVEEYFTNYIVNDSLGIIANAHTVFADMEPDKAMSPNCLELAKLFSVAVDFPKTGVPAEIPSKLRVKEYPDFMEKYDKSTYESKCVIGKLFREVKEIAPHNSSITSFTKEVARRSYDKDMEVYGFEDYVDDAFDYKSNYDYKLGNLLDYYGIKTEAEILSGSIMKMSKSFDKRKDAEAITLQVKSLRKNARTWFKKKEEWSDAGTDSIYAKASAWYHVTYHPDYWGKYNEGLNRPHFLSFAWCVYDKLIHIKKEKLREAHELHLFGQHFSRGLNLS